MARRDPFDYDVFVAYPGKDVAHALAMAEALRAVGLRAFIDLDLLPGSDITTAIPDAVERSRVFVWLISPRSVDSWYDKDEGALAIARRRNDGERRRLVPIRLGAQTTKAFGTSNVVDLVVADPPTPDELAQAADTLQRVVADARTHDPEPAAQPTTELTPRPVRPLPPLDRPYPLLAPYTQPALFAGRDADRDQLVARLRDPNGHSVILLHAPSGAGKSSLLRAGVLPALRGQLDDTPAMPVALVDVPHQPHLVDGLLAELVDGARPVQDHAALAVADAFAAVPGGLPICILDQFEEIFAAPEPAARARVGLALSATVLGTRRTARWVLSYRDDYHGRVTRWLRDVLAEARAEEWPIAGLRFDLSAARAFVDCPLPLFGDPAGGEDARAAARQAFAAAIERPLDAPGAPWRWRVDPPTRDALADAFATARLEDAAHRSTTSDPDAAPLVPELQVVLARLMAEAGDDQVLRLRGDDLGLAADALISNALRDHLSRALDQAVHTWRRRDSAEAQHRILLALQRLTAERRRGPAVDRDTLIAVIGTNGDDILELLADDDRRLVISEAADDPDDQATRYHRLSHDRLAEAVQAEITDRIRKAHDDDPLVLEAFIEAASTSFARGSHEMARLSAGRRRAIAALPEVVREASDARQSWWAAVEAHGRKQRRDRALLGAIVLVALVALGVYVTHTLREAETDAQISSTDPATNWQGLARRVAGGTAPDDAVAGLPDEMSWTHRRGLLAEAFVDDLDPAVECPIRRALIDRIASQVGAPRDFGALLAAADRLAALAARHSSCVDPANGARAHVVEKLEARYGEPPPVVTEALRWRPIPKESVGDVFECQIGSPVSEAGRQNDEAVRTVRLTRFEAMTTEVTNNMFAAFRSAVGSRFGRSQWPGVPQSDLGRYPANVAWYDATAFAAWVGGRLPTEAEWECMARAGSTTAYWSGDGEAALADIGWYIENSEGQAHPVGEKTANPWGLHDVHGNVWEWTADWYSADRPAEGALDPRGPAGGGLRVMRGASWMNFARSARAAHRGRGLPGDRGATYGFRVVRPTPALDH